MTFSERIIEIKNNRKLLQKDIAQAINVTVRQYQRYEKNQTQPAPVTYPFCASNIPL